MRAIFFDVDGVLLDSLPAHLKICEDQARRLSLAIDVPSPAAFRAMVAAGATISPMINFFLAVGFPPVKAGIALDAYEREFGRRYRPTPFDGVERMLRKLDGRHYSLGLATSNISRNVDPELAAALNFFNPRLRFYLDGPFIGANKADMLHEGARRLGVPPRDCLYIGDQPADGRAAAAAGFRFLAVGYGWCDFGASPGFVVAGDINQIADCVESYRIENEAETLTI